MTAGRRQHGSRAMARIGWAAASHGGILARCAETARTLLTEPRDVVVPHGDLHHGNVLDFGARRNVTIFVPREKTRPSVSA